MSGHSKWSTIKRKKAATDAKRGHVFSKIAKEIMVAAREGGGDPEANITLRSLVGKARSANMPADNIDRAIKKGTGELEGANALEEISYEGYAPGGVAVIVQTLTDNRNRTTAEVRHVFTKFDANLAGQGSVARTFCRKGDILVNADGVDEDQLLEWVLEAGADDMVQEDQHFEIFTDPSSLEQVVTSLEKQGVAIERSGITLLPESTISVEDKKKASRLLEFVEALEDLDDVNDVYANFDIGNELLETLKQNEPA